MSNAPIDSGGMSTAFRKVRETVLRMLTVIEDPDSTAQETQRACSTIRDAIELQDAPDHYGSDLAECELNAAVSDPSIDRLAVELDSQEAAFADKLRHLMKARALTQAELAARIGCTQPAISQMLKRRCRPQKQTILNLADALDVNPVDLWPDLDVSNILDTVAAVQQDQTMSSSEAEVFRRALQNPPSEAPAAPLPKRKR